MAFSRFWRDAFSTFSLTVYLRFGLLGVWALGCRDDGIPAASWGSACGFSP